jgi:hypothetical protein
MKEYPSITNEIRYDIPIVMFLKLDGSNFRSSWTPKRGFSKFGSRHQLIDESNLIGKKAIPILKSKYEEWLSIVFRDQKWKEEVLCFFEFHGPNSHFGQHLETEDQTLTLIDVNPLRKGILHPKEFIKLFGGLDIPKILYEGYLTPEIVKQVKDSSLPGMDLEGVVCKGSPDKRNPHPAMFKIKSQAWLNKLKLYCQDDSTLFEKLQ